MLLERCNYLEVEEYLKISDTIIIPVGSIENHGLHMPLGTDYLIPGKISGLINEISPVMIAPALPYGATDDLSGFAGTISIGTEGLVDLLYRICDQLFSYGFRHFVILNGHGGNSKAIEAVGHRIYKKGGILAIINWWLIAGQINPEWKGGHGGGEETAAIMGVDETLIKKKYLTRGEEIENDLSDELPSSSWTSSEFKGGMVTIPRPVKRITKNGWLTHGMSINPPIKASPEWGKEMLQTMAEYTRDFCIAFEKTGLDR